MKSKALFPAVFAMTFLASALSPTISNILSPRQQSERYCNERFEFCVEYPNGIFTETVYADNGDGVVLSTTREDVTMTISGMYDLEERSTIEVMDELTSSIDHVTIQTEDTEDNFTIRYTDEDKYTHFLRGQRLSNRYVYVQVSAKNAQLKDLARITKNLRILDNPAISTTDGVGAP